MDKLELVSLTSESHISVNNFLNTISAPHLSELWLVAFTWAGQNASLEVPKVSVNTASHIRSLVLGGEISAGYLAGLLSLFLNLEVLQFASPWERRTFSHTQMIELLTEPGRLPSLQKLSLHNMYFQHTALQRFIDARTELPMTPFHVLELSQCSVLSGRVRIERPFQLRGIRLETWVPPFW
ncbi:hypothetical protein CALCODRAFT_355592 [Calocera cornea HHB12733]|uniref:F-box domain-containing protein n=1 Tax=Calocera cornea HHB12733 TaxID=1353952 RepID=A0A165EPW2_9BASI|nr:hypothetical protein CALCODRAFT_355592 [Calocera cornea HHB12733]